MTRMCLRRMRRRRASSVRAWRCRERRERVRGVDRDAMRCDAMRCDACCVCVRSSRVRCAARVRRGVCVRDVYVCARARVARGGRAAVVLGWASSAARDPERGRLDARTRARKARAVIRVFYVRVGRFHARVYARMDAWMDGWMDGWRDCRARDAMDSRATYARV